MKKSLAAYMPIAKNGSVQRLAVVFLILFGSITTASAQLSLMLGGSYQQYTTTKKGDPFLFGINPRLGFDLGQRMQVSLNSNFEYFAEWDYRDNIRPGGMGVVFSTYVPAPSTTKGLGVAEFSALYSYYFLGKNYTSAGMYASAGPGIACYINKTSALASPSAFGANTDVQLDMRVGGQYNIVIGWLYLEGRIAPTLHRTAPQTDESKKGALYGVNLGVRYLLNRHPYCVD